MIHRSSNSATDLQLAVSLQQGNRQSLAVVCDKYAPALAGIISRMVNETSLEEKILNDSFINAWKQIAAFKPTNSTFFTWLINITRQTAFAAIKSQQKTNQKDNDLVYYAPLNTTHQQAAFDLVYYKGLTYAEAATALQSTLATVKADINIILNNLKQQTSE